MNIFDILFIGVGLSMDAFAVSVCKGLAVKRMDIKKALLCGLYFGIFQALMPLIGYILGSSFQNVVSFIDHWIAFVLLGIIGINMIKEAKSCEVVNNSMDVKTMVTLAIATSIDALAIGVTFAFLKVKIVPAISIIGVITFVCCVVGFKLGSIFGEKLKVKAEIVGGVVLIIIGTKILIEHLFFGG
ncbi:MAG: manganese efflux pump MntP [Catonella sp.]|uniref:manganese efflux pump MntP n=1 Tax=Catonella sp. TaxID=2382125 RepID=UPI003F9EE02A